jgi:hypothetical protein
MDDLIKRGYTVEFLRGESAIRHCCICNRDFIDENFEKIALESTQDKDTYGIFVSRDNETLTTLIFTLEGYECEIVLLCSNERTSKGKLGVTSDIMRYFLDKLKDLKIKRVTLKIAKENLNKKAYEFYKKFGFRKKVTTRDETGTYILEL